jgi:hypothetical protein
MNNVTRLNFSHPLVGTWVTDEEDSRAEFTISMSAGGFAVTGHDISDGEAFVISNISWNGEVLRFDSLMPSTQYAARHAVRMAPDGKTMEHEFTLMEIWRRKPEGE